MKYEHNAEFSVARNIDSIFNNIAIIIRQRNGTVVEKNEYSLVAKLGNRFVARLLGISLLSLVKKLQLPTLVTVNISKFDEEINRISVNFTDNLGWVFRDSFAGSEYKRYYAKILDEITQSCTQGK